MFEMIEDILTLCSKYQKEQKNFDPLLEIQSKSLKSNITLIHRFCQNFKNIKGLQQQDAKKYI